MAPISKIKDHIIGFIFVDDVDLEEGNLKSSSDTFNKVVERMQVLIDKWEESLKVTGGVIRLDKFFAYPINFVFKQSGEYKYEAIESMDTNLLIKNEYGIREELSLIEVDRGMETLGVYMVPSEDIEDQRRALDKKIGK